MTATCTDVFWGEMAPCDHLLQLYDRDDVMLDALEGFVAGGIRVGDAAIVIATPAHLAALEARLTAAGVDVAEAQASDQFIPLEAEEMLGRFMANRWPDEQRFQAAISELLGRARGGGRRVRAFGEMVALLWAQGDAAATVRLEHLWNKLCQAERFSLFCAYPTGGFTKEMSKSIGEICAAHSHIMTIA
jgi:hypothetical protein